MSVGTAHMVYFCAHARSGIFQKKKNARELGVGRVQFYAGMNGKKTKQNKTKNPWHSKFLQSELAHPGHNFASS